MILYTVLPVVAVYLVLFGLGVAHVSSHLRGDAQVLLVEHARHQASRLALLLAQAPALAEGLGDLVLADPQLSQELLYAHLIDGLRRTPAASTAAVAFRSPSRSALMQRGTRAARPLAAGESLARSPGWHVMADSIGFSRPIYRSGKRVGDTWVVVPIADIYRELDAQRTADARLFVRHADNRLLPPPDGDAQLSGLIGTAPLGAGVRPVAPVDGSDYWLINAQVPGFPWWVTAVIPVRSALAEVRHEVWLFAAGLLLSLLVIVAIIGAVARQITRPLETLDDAVQRISGGDFVVAPEVHSQDELGRLASAIGRMARHIADREHQLRSSHQALEQRVAERTSALQEANARLTRQIAETRKTQEALRLANEQAQQANRAKSEFLSNMSHELRTPLHGVLGYAQILRREIDVGDTRRESLDAIERCGQHLLTLINEILDLTKIEAGEMRVEMHATNLMQLISDVCTIVAQRAEQKGLTLRHEVADDVPRDVRTDAGKLRQVLLNLLGNAVKFTSHGSIVLSVGVAADGRLAFAVADSGVGIPEDKIDAIFDAFQQARQGQTVDGTGLGLAISQRLIRLLGGGALRVDSTPGEGSRFSFHIPCETLADSPAARARPAARRGHLAAGQQCSVLVVDANREGRDVVSTLLRHIGCDVEAFEDRDGARRRLGERAVDLVLVDVRLPDEPLPPLVAALRDGAAFGAPKLVAISAHVFADSRQRVQAAGFDDFLAKPFGEQQVLDLIDALTAATLVSAGDATAPPPSWPAALAGSTAERIRTAIAMGDVASLFQLAEDLAGEPGAPPTDVEALAMMARMFDFDGLRDLSERLRAAS